MTKRRQNQTTQRENAVERMKSEFTTSRMVAAYEDYYSGLLEE